MKNHALHRTAAAVLLAMAGCASAMAQQQPVKIGFIGTLSTPAGYIGEDEQSRDGSHSLSQR